MVNPSDDGTDEVEYAIGSKNRLAQYTMKAPPEHDSGQASSRAALSQIRRKWATLRSQDVKISSQRT
jgi:hypothetical protein